MYQNVLEVNDLVKKYREFSLKEVSFKIPRGYIMGFSGQNGAGKSTTLKCIMDLIKYESGNINVFGLDNIKHSTEIKGKLGYVSEEQYFYDHMTVEWTGNFVGSFYKSWDKAFFNKLLDRFNVDSGKKIRELSKGMKTKLSLALAMAHKPELLILDEPTSGLDPVVRNELLEIFLEIMQNEDSSIFFSTHITSDIEKVADYITIIENGSIIVSESKDSILDKWVVVKAENRYLNNDVQKSLIGFKQGDFGYSGITDNFERFKEKFKEDFPEGNLITSRISLDEYMLRIVKEGGVHV